MRYKQLSQWRYAIVISTYMLGANALAHGDIIEASPKISYVTVFTNNAMIKKEGKVSLKKGENTIELSDFTPAMLDSSLQLKMIGSSEIKISDVKVQQTFLQKIQHEKIKKLQSKLDQLLSQITTNTNQVAIITSSNDFLKRTTPFSQNQKVLPSEMEAHAKFLENSLAQNYNRIAKIELQNTDLQKEKAPLEQELKLLETPEQSKSIQISLSSPRDLKDQKFEISYMINNAHWNPQYILNADTNTKKVQWSDFASISQSSGEDWTNASIEISTAKPFGTKAPAALEAWYIDTYHPPRSAYVQLEMMEKRETPTKAMIADSYAEPVTQQESTSFSFVLPGKITIPSDNQPHKVFIASSSNEADFHYRAVPRLSLAAYLTAVLNNPFPFPLLSGKMTLLLDGKVVDIRTTAKTIFPQEEVQLSLGADESIKIEHKQKKKFNKESGIISKETQVIYEYTNEVTNGKNKPIHITIEDHFPVSQNEQIKVVLDMPQKNSAKITNEGIITWDLELKAHEQKVLPVNFTVSHPEKINITGLE
jgi:uncharacterized protein (TIGR02231 family)